MKIRYYISLALVFLSCSSAFSLNDEVEEQIKSPLSATKVLTKTWNDEALKSQKVNNREIISQQKKLKICSELDTPCGEQTEGANTSSNIVVENGILTEKSLGETRRYWISESK